MAQDTDKPTAKTITVTVTGHVKNLPANMNYQMASALRMPSLTPDTNVDVAALKRIVIVRDGERHLFNYQNWIRGKNLRGTGHEQA